MTQQQQRPQPTERAELVPIDTATHAIALVPQSLEGAMQLARWLALSSFLPEALRGKEGDIFAIVLAGAELGLPPMAALRGIYVVNGRTALEAKTKAAICVKRGAALYFRRTEHTALATTWETLRAGEAEPRSYRYTRVEADAAGLTQKVGPWKSYAQRMISHRALGWLCDDAYPDVVLGVATSEDFDGEDDIAFKPLGAPPSSHPTKPAPTAAAQAKPAVEPVPLLTEDEIIELITAIGNAGSEPTLKEIGARFRAAIQAGRTTDAMRDRIAKAYEEQLVEIRAAVVTEAKAP